MSLLSKFKEAAEAALDSYLSKSNQQQVMNETGYEQDDAKRKGFISIDGPANQQGFFKERMSYAGPVILRNMARRDSLVVAIHQALINQVSNFTQPQRDKYSPGFRFVARRPADLSREEKLSLSDPNLEDDAYDQLKFELETKKTKMQEQQDKDIELLTNFLLHGGKDKGDTDTTFKRFDFDRFIKLITRDRLTYNYAAVELIPTRDYSKISGFYPVSAGTIRFVAARSRKHYADTVSPMLRGALGYEGREEKTEKPYRYVQVIRGRPVAAFTEDELIFEAGNPTVDPEDYGYGQGELEWLVTIITSHLYAEAHNRNFFTQGIGNKGILHIKGDNISRAQLEGFKRQWFNQLANSRNAFRPPIIGMADEVKYVSLAQSNREMEFTEWMNYLIKISCFTPDTRILLPDGSYKRIEDALPGDKVVTHSGAVKEVQNLQIKNVDEELVHIRVGGDVIKATKEHPFYSVLSEVNGHALREFEDPEWVQASGLVAGRDYLVVPQPKFEPETIYERIDLSEYVDGVSVEDDTIRLISNNSKKYKRFIDLTPENAFVLGLFVAEGFAGKYACRWCFHKDELDYKNRVVAFANEMGMTWHDATQKENSLTLQTGSGAVARAFQNLFGTNAHEKKVPKEILNAPLEIQAQFLSGLIGGDGCVSATSNNLLVQYDTASSTLRDQVRHMLKLQGIYAQYYENIRKTGYKPGSVCNSLRITGTQLIDMAEWLSGEKGDKLRAAILERKGTLKQKVYKQKNSWYVPIAEIWKERYSGKVYNMEVQDEHTYVVEGYAVHNCAIYQIDPAEINFDITKTTTSTLNESSSEHRIKSSKTKGLRPLLMYIQNIINHQIIPRFSRELADKYFFEFAGLDTETKMQEVERLEKETQVYKTVNEVRTEQGLSPIEDGDIILSAAYTQYKQMRVAAEQQEEAMANQQDMMPEDDGADESDDYSDIEGDLDELTKELEKEVKQPAASDETTKKSLTIEYHHFDESE